MPGQQRFRFPRPARRARSRLQLRVHRDVRLEQARDGAAGLRGVRNLEDLRPVRAGDFRRHIKMGLGDCETSVGFFHRDRCAGVDGLGSDAGLAQFRGEGHRETTRVGGGNEFLGIGADAVFEARAEGVLRFLEHAALCGYGAFAILQTSAPDCRCFSFHVRLCLA